VPSLSTSQSRYLNVKFGHAWVKAHHFDNATTNLPKHIPAKTKARKMKVPPKESKR
jgi:hypothetical protein